MNLSTIFHTLSKFLENPTNRMLFMTPQTILWCTSLFIVWLHSLFNIGLPQYVIPTHVISAVAIIISFSFMLYTDHRKEIK